MFCRFCGKNIGVDSLFCPYCGKALESNHIESEKKISQPAAVSFANFPDDAYYLKQASKMAGRTLVSITKILCYVALAVFLFLNFKMTPLYGITHDIIFLLTSAIAIGFVVLFNKKVFTGRSKVKNTLVLIFSLIVIVVSIGLRVVYESKVDSVTAQFPSSGSVKLTVSTDTDYYNSTGTGSVYNPRDSVRIGEKWYESGDIIKVNLDEEYSMRVSAGGSIGGGYTDTNITFTAASFSNGQYRVTHEVWITSDQFFMSDVMAEVQLTFSRYCTFWDVILG